MAKETLDAAVADNPGLKPEQSSQTDGLLLEGAHGWTPTMYIKLVQDLGVDTVLAEHLSETYGDRAFEVGRLASRTGKRWPVVGVRLHPEYPYIEAEVSYTYSACICIISCIILICFTFHALFSACVAYVHDVTFLHLCSQHRLI